jgi:head-tail adaptor
MTDVFNFKTFKNDPKRPRIGQSVAAILANIAIGKATTAIIVPPRYGKSNIIRCAAIESTETGLSSCNVVLAPWRALRSQIARQGKIRKMVADMQISLPSGRPIDMRILTGENIAPDFWKQQVHLWAMTIAGAQQAANAKILCDLAAYFRSEGMPPLVVFIDEGHTVSGQTGWGALAIDLERAGAHVVLLTGTPYRADNIAPFGFKTKEVDRDGGREYSTIAGKGANGRITVQRRRGDKVTYELIADVNCPLGEAWTGGIIAKLQARWFTYQVDNNPLADIGDRTEAKRALSAGVRELAVTEEAVQLFVNDIAARRQTMPHSAGIVFTGNDFGEDGKDAHAHQAVAMVKKEWLQQFGQRCDITIATLDVNGDGKAAAAIIQRFVGDDDAKPPIPGRGDVIVVKMMGGVGLDVARLKTALDLSTIRTKGNTTQRWLRVATLWAAVAHGTLVLPDDPITVQLFDELIATQGGQFSVMENVTVLEEKEVDAGSQDRPIISNPEAAGSTDIDGGDIDEPDFDSHVRQIIADYPFLTERLTYPEISEMVKAGALRPKQQASGIAPEPSPSVPSSDLASVANSDAEKQEQRDKFNEATSVLATREVDYGIAREQWRERRTHWASMAKRHAGITCKLGKCNDIDRLRMAVAYLEQIVDTSRASDATSFFDDVTGLQ